MSGGGRGELPPDAAAALRELEEHEARLEATVLELADELRAIERARLYLRAGFDSLEAYAAARLGLTAQDLAWYLAHEHQ